jgi:hypothetical protein
MPSDQLNDGNRVTIQLLFRIAEMKGILSIKTRAKGRADKREFGPLERDRQIARRNPRRQVVSLALKRQAERSVSAANARA